MSHSAFSDQFSVNMSSSWPSSSAPGDREGLRRIQPAVEGAKERSASTGCMRQLFRQKDRHFCDNLSFIATAGLLPSTAQLPFSSRDCWNIHDATVQELASPRQFRVPLICWFNAPMTH